MRTIRQRYVLFEIFAQKNQNFTDKKVLRVIWQKLSQIFGEIISFKAGLWLIAWDPINLKGILRCDHLVDEKIIATLGLIQNINGIPVIFHTRKTTGTIKKAQSHWKSIFKLPIPENS